jgi:hypothetical protein
MKHLLFGHLLILALNSSAFANGGPAATGIGRGTAGIDERDLDSTSAREAQTQRQSTRERAQENERHGSFPGSFGTIDRQQEEIAPSGPLEYEGIKQDPYLQRQDPED